MSYIATSRSSCRCGTGLFTVSQKSAGKCRYCLQRDLSKARRDQRRAMELLAEGRLPPDDYSVTRAMLAVREMVIIAK